MADFGIPPRRAGTTSSRSDQLRDAIAGTIEFRAADGREYRLKEETAVLMLRPRGWHLPERHVRVDG